MKCWDIESGKCTLTCSAPRNIVTTLEPSPVSAGVLYQGSEDLFIRVWDTRAASSSAGPAQVISGFVYFPVCMSVHPDGNLLATGCKGFDGVGCTVKLWDLRATAQPVAEYASHSQDVVGCAFSSRDPDLLLSTSKDGSIRVWDTTSASSDPKVAAFASIPHTGKLNSCLAVPITPMQDLAIAKSAVYEQPMDGGSTGSSPLDDNHVAVGAMDGSITLASMRRERTGDSCRGALTVYCTTAARQGDGNDNE